MHRIRNHILVLVLSLQLQSTYQQITIRNNEIHVLQKLAETVTYRYFLHVKCIVVILEMDSVMNSGSIFSTFSNLQIPHIILKSNDHEATVENILRQSMLLSCNEFIINALNSTKVSEYLYHAHAITRQSREKRFLFLEENSGVIHLDSNFLGVSPNVVIAKPPQTIDLFNRSIYKILSHQFGNYLKPSTLVVVDKFNGITFTNDSDIYSDKFNNLNRLKLKLVTAQYRPYCYVQSGIADGIECRAMQEISRKYNFSWDVEIAEDGFGIFHDNGTISGLFGTLASGKAQVGIGGFYHIEAFKEYFEITDSYMQAGITFLVAKPQKISYLWYIFLPFSTRGWILVVVRILFGICLLQGFSVFCNKLFPNRRKNLHSDAAWSIMTGMRLSVGIGVSTPMSDSIHILEIALLIASMLNITEYNSNLVSFLTVPLYLKPIETVQEFAESGQKWGLSDLAWLVLFKDIQDHNTQKIKDKYMYVKNMEEFNVLAETGKISVLVERVGDTDYFTNADFLHDSVLNALYLMREDVLRFHVGALLERLSPMTDKFNKVLMWLRDTGIIFQWTKEIYQQHEARKLWVALSYNVHQESFHKLSMEFLAGIFVVLIIGSLCALCAFVAELCIYPLYVLSC